MTMQQISQADKELFQLRTFTMGDYEQVVDLWRRTGIRVGPSDSREGIGRRLRRDEDLFLVAITRQEHVIGAVLGGFDGRRGWVNHLAVEPTLQEQGIGKALLERLEVRLRAQGCIKLNLLVAGDNTGVLGFYKKQGFQSSDVVFMEKWLS
ncbi:MAG TPA: GNAT family acetyltransferase [Ktedonobacteraceae bacterium]